MPPPNPLRLVRFANRVANRSIPCFRENQICTPPGRRFGLGPGGSYSARSPIFFVQRPFSSSTDVQSPATDPSTLVSATNPSYSGFAGDSKAVLTDAIHITLLWLGKRFPSLNSLYGPFVSDFYKRRAYGIKETIGKVIPVKEYDHVSGSLEIAKMLTDPVKWILKKLFTAVASILGGVFCINVAIGKYRELEQKAVMFFSTKSPEDAVTDLGKLKKELTLFENKIENKIEGRFSEILEKESSSKEVQAKVESRIVTLEIMVETIRKVILTRPNRISSYISHGR